MRHPSLVAIAAFASVTGCAGHPSHEEVAQMSGKQMYQQLCTSCHGASAKGDGPMAPLLKIDVPDLTLIARRHGGEFPAESVRRTIDGRFEQRAHGLPYMPVWGVRFHDPKKPQDAEESARIDATIGRLVDYLRSIQER